MVLYECIRCGKFKTEIKTHYIRHLNRKKKCKPINKIISTDTLLEQIYAKESKIYPKKTPKKGVYTPFSPFLPQNGQNIPQKKPKKRGIYTKNYTQKNEEDLTSVCEFCDKKFSRLDHLKRHINICKIKKKQDSNVQNNLLDFFKEQMQEMKEAHQKDREAWQQERIEMRKEIENLLEKVGNVTNTINIKEQNIILNTYGHENLDYLSNSYISNLIKAPFGAVPKLIKYVHFNPKHPENHNIKITNKKLPYASVWEGDKWTVKDKKQVIENMVDKSYNLIDEQYQDNKDELETQQIKKFENFKEQYDNHSGKLHKNIKKDTEIIVLNNSNLDSK